MKLGAVTRDTPRGHQSIDQAMARYAASSPAASQSTTHETGPPPGAASGFTWRTGPRRHRGSAQPAGVRPTWRRTSRDPTTARAGSSLAIGSAGTGAGPCTAVTCAPIGRYPGHWSTRVL